MKINLSTILTFSILTLVLLAVALFMLHAKKERMIQETAESPAFQALEAANESKFVDFDGNPVSLTEHVGKIIIAHSWASWCPSCANELQKLATLKDYYEKNNVAVLAINRAENQLVAERFLKAYSLDKDVHLVLDPDDNFYNSIDGYAMPETVIYNKKGEVLLHVHGEFSEEKLRSTIEDAMEADYQ